MLGADAERRESEARGRAEGSVGSVSSAAAVRSLAAGDSRRLGVGVGLSVGESPFVCLVKAPRC